MPNCDWNQHCDCIDCRSSSIEFNCPKCGEITKTTIVECEEQAKIGRKGDTIYIYSYKCPKCGQIMEY